MGERLVMVNAFTERPFAGNPAAVCLLDQPRDDQWQQAIAAELNLAETAFLTKQADGYGLRWFTPKVEVDLCGHATLASAHVLWQDGLLEQSAPARFHTKSGLLTATLKEGLITLDFPATPPAAAALPPGVAGSLGAEPSYVGRSRFDYLLEVADAATLRGLRPDFAALSRLPVRGVIVTCRSDDPRYDFLSRFFAPAAGVDEDPVTGSVHCCLVPYWQQKLGKTEFTAYQASARGGVLRLSLRGERVLLGGHAVTIWRGELAV